MGSDKELILIDVAVEGMAMVKQSFLMAMASEGYSLVDIIRINDAAEKLKVDWVAKMQLKSLLRDLGENTEEPSSN